MNKVIVLLISFLYFGVSHAQLINLEIADPHPELQDADVGDMEFGDIDNDGDQDLIMIGKGGPILTTIYINDGNGNFIESANTELENVFNGTIGLNDIDNDGDLDLLITGTKSSVPSVNLYLNDGTGIFSPTTTSLSPSAGGDFAFGDVDNDNDDDLFLTGAAGSSGADLFTKLYLNDGNGVFSESTSNPFEQLASRVEFFDCDGDNDLDLIVSATDYNSIRLTILYVNDGLGNFSEVANTGFNNIGGGDIAIGDSDNDGDLDVLICGNLDATDIQTELYLNDGIGNFTLLENTVFSKASFGEVSFNDFDNDDDLDVFVLGTGPGGLQNNAIIANVYENLGSNNFIVSDSLIGGYLASHAVADVDGDNYLDLVLGGTTIGTPVRATWMYTNLALGALPVELISFTANLNEQKEVVLDWKTGAEINSNHFSVQRSRDGFFFEELEKVNAAGDTGDFSSYQIEDKNPFLGYSYYRLKMVDNDETFSLSETRTIQVNGEKEIEIFPNPVSNNSDLYISGLSQGEFNLTIYDATGRLVYEEKIILENLSAQHKIRLPELSEGMYTYSIFRETDLIKSGRLVMSVARK